MSKQHFVETLESRRLLSGILTIPDYSAPPAENEQVLLDTGEWGRRISIVSTEAGDVLRVFGWVGSGSIGVRFDEALVDDAGRFVLPVTFNSPGDGMVGTCDMKAYGDEALLPEDFRGQIVLRVTNEQTNWIEGLPAGTPWEQQTEIELVSIGEMVVREALPELPPEAAPPMDLPVDAPAASIDELPAATPSETLSDPVIDLSQPGEQVFSERPIEAIDMLVADTDVL